ncbi:MAG: nucleotide exchange factor GrpE [Candidatus Helarchaeota archaeon]
MICNNMKESSLDDNNQSNNEKIDYYEKYLKAKADLENYKKFCEKQKSDYIKYANEKLLLEILKIYDDLKRAIKSMNNHNNNIEKIKTGLKLILENFRHLIEKEGIRSINCVGEEFDPNLHECVMVENSDEPLPDDLIIEELEEGYTLNGKVIRPSRVKIIKNY